MSKLLYKIFLGFIVSFYFFPTSFTFIPHDINSKMILAFLGVILCIFECVRRGGVNFSMDLLGATGLVCLFSLICFISTDYNNTYEYVYATYFISFATWLLGAYTVCAAIRVLYGKVTLSCITAYLAAVGAIQCIVAVLIDRIEALNNVVLSIFWISKEFFDQTDRLYGIGASLDSGGVRFCIILVMIAFVICRDKTVYSNRKTVLYYLLSYFIISIIGSMISRTTGVGILIGFAFIFWETGILKLMIKSKRFKFLGAFAGILVVLIPTIIYLYHADATFYRNIRFAFEGFFNWMETGKWETASTNILKTMWIWPDTLSGWIIGTGKYGVFVFGTDIGYCNFILYCGLLGFGTFASFFIYNAVVMIKRAPQAKMLFLMLMITGFIIWAKVATDIFQIYALFYCMESIGEHEEIDRV